MRTVLKGLLEEDPTLSVIGMASNGQEAVEQVAVLNPDVVTIDVEMPKLDGLGALRRIMAESPCPVVMVSSLTRRGASDTVQALALGAVDFVLKPSGAVSLDLYQVGEELRTRVKRAAEVRMRSLTGPTGASTVTPDQVATQSGCGSTRRTEEGSGRLSNLVVIAASTGGPGALHRMVGPLPADLNAGLLIVQHMPPGFTAALAEHLGRASSLIVREAAQGDGPTNGVALLAPGGSHMLLDGQGRVIISSTPPRHGVRPAADVTLESIPVTMARRALVIVLTGMGRDGAAGAATLKEQGAEVWVQDEASCVVFGMPKAVLEMGVADRSGTPEQISYWLRHWAEGASRL